ncbi:hypothetical protein ACB092_11G085600 [Castanea dentata]
MISKANAVVHTKFRILFSAPQHLFSFPMLWGSKPSIFFTSTTYSTKSLTQVETAREEVLVHPKDSIEVFRKWGCSDNEISKLFVRRPSLRNANITQLQSKLNILSGLGIGAPDLVKIIHCRPRFLSCRINHCFDERLEFFKTLFVSRDVLAKAIVRNPSLLTYDFHNTIKPAIALYEEIGVCKKDLISMLLSRPTIIPRTSFGDEKMEYIRKTGISKESKMFKYVVTLIGISRHETIRKKVANLEKFGFSDDEIFNLFGRSPLLLTLSVDKVQRNMTFILGMMKLPASVVLQYPFLLYSNLEAVLRPRVLLAQKIDDMGLNLQIKGLKMMSALRMTEKRFLEAFVKCHPKNIADELIEFYTSAKGIKRLAEASKKNNHMGFPF